MMYKADILSQVGFVVAERVLYSPSIGFCILLPLFLHVASKNKPKLEYSLQIRLQ